MIHEFQFIEKLEKDSIYQAWHFRFTFRYTDDPINLHKPTFHTFISVKYPNELQIRQEITKQDSGPYLELQYTIQDEQFHTRYDRRDCFNFNVVNNNFAEKSNLPETPAYGVCQPHQCTSSVFLEFVTYKKTLRFVMISV